MKSLQKTGDTPKKARARRARKLANHERLEKTKVRLRDGRCRFPLCGCRFQATSPMKAIPTVSHDFHKGMGGDPTGASSKANVMMQLCKWRHQDAPVSRHAGTFKTQYLTDELNDGPVVFLVDLQALYPVANTSPGDWFVVARERWTGPHSRVLEVEPLTPHQREVLNDLAEMTR